jgi:hypothetical protein
MPRDPERIKRINDLILEIWTERPDLRLTQLIGNCFPPHDLYNTEDDILELSLRKMYSKEKKK